MDYKKINDYEQLYLIAENDEDSRTLMFEKYKPIVLALAQKYYNTLNNNYKISLEDLVQEGYIGLSNAMRTFRDDAGACFYTYSVICIERSIVVFCRGYNSKRNSILNNACQLDSIASHKVKKDSSYYYEQVLLDNLPDSCLADDYCNNVFIEFKNNLEGNESKVFELRANGFKYKEIARLLDISVSGVDRIIRNIKRKYQREVKLWD